MELGLAVGLGTSGVVSLTTLSRGYPQHELLANPEWLKGRLEHTDRFRIVDARGPLDYAEGHIPQAVNLWDREVNTWTRGFPRLVAPPGRIAEGLGGAGIDEGIIVITYGDHGNLWAARLFWTLEYYGHPQVRILNGGVESWRRAGGRLTEEVPEFPQADFRAEPDLDKLATGGWLKEHLEDPGVQIVDTRSPAEYRGKEARARRGGHIPGALLVPWENTVTEDGVFRRYLDLEIIYRKAGLKKKNTIVTYSHTGVRAAHGYFALRLLGYPRVRVYDASWAEWGNDERFPIAAGGEALPEEEGSLCW